MIKNIQKLAILFLLVSIYRVNAQEVVVRLAPQVSVAPEQNGTSQKYRSSDAAIQQILDQYEPQEISPLFDTIAPATLPDQLKNIQVWHLESQGAAEAAIQKLSANLNVIYAEPNHRYRVFEEINDPLSPEQWYLHNISARGAWKIETGQASVIVGVIDTGMDYFHEDLQGQLWINNPEDLNQNGMLDSLDINGIDDDGNGYIDDVIGWDFTHAPNFPDQGDYLDPDNDPMDEFGSGHGTSVAGIIAAAQNNQTGISGIAPGARVMALRAGTASGFLEEDDVAEAILYAIANGCKVVNMSFGDVAVSYLLKDAIEYGVSQGLIFVASAGNSGNSTLNYPAAYGQTISVGATDSTDRLAGFSNYGSTVNLVAPGLEIFSTQIGNSYGLNNGTSFSAPVVSAAVALIWSHYPNYSPEQVKGALFAGCRDLGFFGWDSFYGHGLVNLERSLKITEQGYGEIAIPATGSGTAENEIAIRGTVFSPGLISYSLSYGFGENPYQWLPITEVFATQVLQDTLALWNIAALPDSVYTLELRVKQYGLNDVVQKNIFYIDHSLPALGQLNTTEMLVGPQNGFLIRFKTDDPTVATLYYRQFGDPQFNLSKVSQYFQDEHNFILSQEDISGPVEFYIHLKNAAGLEAVYDNNGSYYPLNLAESHPYENILLLKQQLSVSGFFMPYTTDFNENQEPEFVISQLIDGEKFGPLQVYEYHNSQYITRQLTNFPLIPRDAGKIHPASGLELLGGYGGNSLILGSNDPGEFPSEIAWDDTTNFWASRLTNLDNDPELELLALNFGRWRIFDISADHQVTLQQTLFGDTTSGNNQFGVPWALVEDLDEDGFREIIVEDLDGDLYIYEEDAGGQYQFTWSTRLPGRGGNSLLQAADVTGDGKKELISAVRNVPEVLRESNANTKFWALTIWKSVGDNQYEKIGQKNFHGVTVQTGIHNGLSTGDIDGDDVSEILFTPFPDAYIFQFAGGEFNFLWYREGVNSNYALVDDLDRNGIPDVLMNSDNGILQFEAASNPNRPLPPLQLQATPLDTNRIRLAWLNAPGADYYKIYRKASLSTFALIDSTHAIAYIDSFLSQDNVYQYAITQVDHTFPEPESGFSGAASAQPNAPPLFLEAQVLQARQVLLHFNEPMSDAAYLTDNYLLMESGDHPASAIRGENRRQVLLSFLDNFSPGINELEMTALSDAQGTPLPQQPLVIEFEYHPAGEPFYIRSVEFVNKQHLLVHFNRPAETASAINPQHYFLEPDGEIISATIDSSNGSAVSIYLSGDTRMGSLGIPYYLTIQNVKDRQGNLLDDSKANRLAIILGAETLAEVMVYPNPFNANTAQQNLMFANLPRGTEILIFSASGQFLKRLEESRGAGGIPWDLRTEDGNIIGSGVYIYVARLNGEEKKGKFVVIR